MLKSLFTGLRAPVAAQSSGRSNSRKTVTGKIIDLDAALTVPVVLAVIKILAEDTARMPLILYRRLQPRGKERATNHTLYYILHDEPNPEQTSMQFREMIVSHIIAWGNFYAQKIVNNAGQLMQLWPLSPARMRVDRDPATNRRRYTYTRANGKQEIFDEEEIWHVPGFGFDGLSGMSFIALLRNSIAISISAEEYRGKFFENDARPGVVYKHTKVLKDEAYRHLQESIEENRTGSENSHKFMILEDGLDIAEIGIPGEDVEFIRTSEFQVREFARPLRVPGFMIGDMEKSTSWGTGIEQQTLGYVNFTLGPWATRIEQSVKKDLMLETEKRIYFVEHLFDVLLRGDIAARYQSYNTGITIGMLNPNEAREKENLEPYEGGDTYRAQLNTTPVNNAQAVFAPVVLDAAARIMRREAHDLVDAARKFAKRGDVMGMGTWLEGFWAEHATFMTLQLDPVARSLAAAGGWMLSAEELTTFCTSITEQHAKTASTLMANVTPELATGLLTMLEGQMPAFEAQAARALTDEFMKYMER